MATALNPGFSNEHLKTTFFGFFVVFYGFCSRKSLVINKRYSKSRFVVPNSINRAPFFRRILIKSSYVF